MNTTEGGLHQRLIVEVPTLQVESPELLSVLEAGVQLAQENVSLQERVHQGLDRSHTAVDHMSRRLFHLNQLPLACTNDSRAIRE